MERALIQFLNDHPTHRQFCIAYSGGCDSHVLLNQLVQLRKQGHSLQLRAVHINHGLHSDADQWAKHCATICEAYELEFSVHSVACLREKGRSLEEIAREARYQALGNQLKSSECLVTAHHQNDQIETAFLQLLRGSGPKGLSGMKTIVPFFTGYLARPLLGIKQAALKSYANQNQLRWIDDPSNSDPDFDRNYIRHTVLPLLEKRWPATLNTFARSVNLCQTSNQLLEELAQIDEKAVKIPKTECLSLSQLKQLPFERQMNLLRYWISQAGHPLPNSKKLKEALRQMVSAQQYASPCVRWQRCEMRRYRDRLYLLSSLEPIDPHWETRWDLKKPLQLPANVGVLEPSWVKKQWPSLEDSQSVLVRFRRPSDTLKRFFQEKAIPPWGRDRIPLIISEDQGVLPLFSNS